MFPYPVLLCDLGGTNCRFAVAPETGAELAPLGNVLTGGFATFTEAVRSVMDKKAIQPASMILCAAGPLDGRSVRLTNADWDIDGPQTAGQLGVQQGLLLNDFEALALSLPAIRPEWTKEIGSVTANPARPSVILGPGTGLGTAGLLRMNDKVLALETEAGHIDFAATNDEEQAIWALLGRFHARITPETVLCGSGLVRLHQARLAIAAQASYDEPQTGDHAAARITEKALADFTSQEAQTVRLFWRLIARYAGDIALTYFAQGGVTLAGGILPRIAPLLNETEFRRVFEDKDPMRKLVQATPVQLLLANGSALHGMAAIAANPSRYAIDYAARCWR